MFGQRVLLTLVLAGGAQAVHGCMIEHTPFLPGSFDSERLALAGVAAEVGADSVAQDVEYVGAVYRAGGRFRVNVGRGCPGQDAFTVRLPVPHRHDIVAFWHTHGADGALRDLFSPQDFDLVESQQRPFYLITPSGELRVLRPGMTIRQGDLLGMLEFGSSAEEQSEAQAQVSARPTNR